MMRFMCCVGVVCLSTGSAASGSGRGGSAPLSDDQKKARAAKTLETKIKQGVITLEAAMWNNGMKLKKKRLDQLTELKTQLNQLLKTDLKDTSESANHILGKVQEAIDSEK